MNVRFAGGSLNNTAATWFPDADSSAFPMLIATKGGECYRLGLPLAAVRIEEDLIYMIDTFNPSHPTQIRGHVFERVRDCIPADAAGPLDAALEPVQQHIDNLSRQLGVALTRIKQLEAKLRASEPVEGGGT